MAETTPDNLGFGQRFAGWMGGSRAAGGNVRLDQSVDRLQEQIDKFSEALSTLTSSLRTAQKNVPGSGTTQAAGSAIGGNWRPPGTWGVAPSGLITPGGVGAPPQGPTQQAPGAPNGGFSAPTGKQMLAGGAIALGVAGASFTANHYGNLQTGMTIGMMSGNPNWSQAYRAGMRNNYVAQGDIDALTGFAMQVQRSGFNTRTQGFGVQKSMAGSASAVNPNLSYTQATANQQSLATTTSFNRLRGQGINPIGASGVGDPRSLARQLLQRMGALNNSKVDPEHVAMLFGPAGPGTVTLDMWVAQGLIPPEVRPQVEQEMRNILLAQSRGMSYSTYNKNANVAQGIGDNSDAARKALATKGIATITPTQRAARTQGIRRESEIETIEGFAAGMDKATVLVDKFNQAIAGFLSIPGVGEAAGAGSGFFGSVGGLGSVLKMLPGGQALGMLGMAGGGVVPGRSPGKDIHRFYSPTGGTIDLSGGEAIMRPEWVDAVGGPVAVAAMNAAANRTGAAGIGRRNAFAGGGTWMGGFKPTQASSISQQSGYSSKWAGDLNDPGSGDLGDPVYAWKAGTVAKVVMLGDRSYGRYIVINHPGGQSSLYAHLSKAIVKAGQKVRQGQRIGSVGNLGNSSGPHLHFEIKGGHSSVGGSSGTTGGSGATGGGGLGLGQAVGNAAAAMANTAVASATPLFQGGTGGSSAGIGGAFSEVAALALTGGGGALGRAPTSSEGGVDSLTGAGGMGSVGDIGGPGGPGDVRIGAYNTLHSRAGAGDFRTIMSKVDVVGLSENRSGHGKYSKMLGQAGWGYYTGGKTDTAIAYDKSKYQVLQKGFQKMQGTLWSGKNMSNTLPYMLLKDKKSGAKFWVISAHTQVRGYRGGEQGRRMRSQYATIAALQARLRKTGAPVFLVGDMNNPKAGSTNVARGADVFDGGIDYLIAHGAKRTDAGKIEGRGFNNQRPNAAMSSDHPFIWGAYDLPGVGGGGGGGAGGKGGGPAANMRLGKAMADARGWDGGQWEALKKLWMRESGWRTHADNPNSSAYGIPQALTQTHNLGAKYKNDPRVQIGWGLNYIKQRYGSPASAWNFWQRNNWYSAGSWNIRDDQDARVHKGEMILPSKVADIVRQELEAPGIRDNLGRKGKGKGSGVQITFERGSINLSLMSGSQREAQQAGEWFAEAFANDRRIRALAEG